MIDLQTTPEKQQARDNDLMHAVCPECSPNIGLCGVSCDEPMQPEDTPVDCVVCAELDWLPCERCGY